MGGREREGEKHYRERGRRGAGGERMTSEKKQVDEGTCRDLERRTKGKQKEGRMRRACESLMRCKGEEEGRGGRDEREKVRL